MKIAALYARVSSARQQQNETIASQLAALREYAATHDYQVGSQHVFQDDGFSGARLDRPALDRLRDAVAQGEIEAVVILSPDRLARQFAYQYILLEEFERAGCEVVFATQPFGDTPADRMMREVTGVFAEYERALIQERCRRGRLHAAKAGQIWMKEGPYGYTYVPKTDTCPARLVVNESEAEVVRQMYHWLVDDHLSTYQIIKRLNASGLRTRRGKERWAGGTIYNLLRNSVYAGKYCYNRRIHHPARQKNLPLESVRKKANSSQSLRPPEEWISIGVPAVIEPEVWEQAQRQMKLNKERAPRNNKKHDYLLKGLLVCGCCQLRMIGHAGIPATRKRRYLCTQKETLHSRPQRCPNRTVQAEMIETLVWQSVGDLLSEPQLLLEQYQLRQTEGDGTPRQQEQCRLERRLTVMERETQRLLDAYQAGALELAELTGRRARLQEEQARVLQRKQELQGQETDRQRREEVRVSVEEFCRAMEDALINPSFETKQKILRLVVERIEFQEDQITIKHLIPIGHVRLCRNQYSGKFLL